MVMNILYVHGGKKIKDSVLPLCVHQHFKPRFIKKLKLFEWIMVLLSVTRTEQPLPVCCCLGNSLTNSCIHLLRYNRIPEIWRPALNCCTWPQSYDIGARDANVINMKHCPDNEAVLCVTSWLHWETTHSLSCVCSPCVWPLMRATVI